jgi:hypothetical protein
VRHPPRRAFTKQGIAFAQASVQTDGVPVPNVRRTLKTVIVDALLEGEDLAGATRSCRARLDARNANR